MNVLTLVTGKVLKGYLDAHGALNGQGIGNPNNEFSPDVSVITLHASGGGTAKVAWGFLNGDVAVTTAPKVMDLGKNAKFSRCRPVDSHVGVVSCLAFGDAYGSNAGTFVSACQKGTVKLWDAYKMRCLWTGQMFESTPRVDGVSIPVAAKRIAFDATSGTIVVAGVNGEIFAWGGFGTAGYVELDPRAADVPHSLSPRFFCRVPALESAPEVEAASLVIRPQSVSLGRTEVELAVAYDGKPHFWKVVIVPNFGSAADAASSTLSHRVRTVKYESRASSPLTAFHCRFVPRETPQIPSTPIPALTSTSRLLLPSLPEQRTLGSNPRSYVLAGDGLGNLCVWDWDDEPKRDLALALDGKEKQAVSVRNHRMFVAHEDGAISAIALDGPVFATGRYGDFVCKFCSGLALTFQLLLVLTARSIYTTHYLLISYEPSLLLRRRSVLPLSPTALHVLC